MTELACSVDGCGKPRVVRGWCRTHYSRWRRNGDPLDPGSRVVGRQGCAVANCTGQHVARGYCNMHYQRWAKHGDPLAVLLDYHHDDRCSVPGCERPFASKGMCSAHYHRWQKGQDLAPAIAQRTTRPESCLVSNCSESVAALGLCHKHYKRREATGSVFSAKLPPALRCKLCDGGSEVDEMFSLGMGTKTIARILGVKADTARRHRRNHINNPTWHAKRAAWWARELATMQAE